MISPAEISQLTGAIAKAKLGLRDEILMIVKKSTEPMCCKDIFEQSECAADINECSREVHQMTSIFKLLEVAEKKPREGFREVSFYCLTGLGQERLNKLASGAETKVQPKAAEVKPIASISKPLTENPMAQTEKKSWLKDITELVGKTPGIKREDVFNKLLLPDESNRKSLLAAISNGLYNNVIRKEIVNGEEVLHLAKKINGSPKPPPKRPQPKHPNRKRKQRPFCLRLHLQQSRSSIRNSGLPSACTWMAESRFSRTANPSRFRTMKCKPSSTTQSLKDTTMLHTQLNAVLLPLDHLFPSPTNPRKRKGFDEKSLNELAASMRPPLGILEPILVRVALQGDGSGAVENKGNFEIIAGERRWRAARIAGLTEAPCILKTFDDEQVLQAQLIENKRREDLDALEEAEGYEKLLQQKNSAGEPYTVQMIADAMGVSKGTIYARMKLLKLCNDGRQAFYDGKIDASKALLIARIPVEKLQLQALQKAVEINQYTDEPQMSYRSFRDYLQQNFMLYLEDAPFDINDADLLPKVGSCKDCPNRTGNQPDIFQDVEDVDVCTDPVCHAMKKTAHVLALQKKYEAEGSKYIAGKDAKKIIPKNYMQTTDQCLVEAGLVKLDAKVPGDEQKRTFRQLLKENKLIDNKKADQPAVVKTVIENPRDQSELIETVSIEQMTKALREAGCDITLKSTKAGNLQDEKAAKAREAEKQELAIENAFRSRLFDTLHSKIETDMLDPESKTFPMLYRRVVIEIFDYIDLAAEDLQVLVPKYTMIPSPAAGKEIDWEKQFNIFRNNLPNLTPAQHLMLIIELALIGHDLTTSWSKNSPQTMLAIAEDLAIDAAAMRKEVAKQHDAEVSRSKAAEKKKAAAKPAEKSAEPVKVRPAATWPFPPPL